MTHRTIKSKQKKFNRNLIGMANSNPSPKTRFKKGQSGNPSGPKRDPILRETKKLTAIEFRDMMAALMKMSQEELTTVMNNKDAPFVWRIYAKMYIKAYNSGNISQVDLTLNRVVGKVADKLEVEDNSKPDVDYLAEKLLEGLKK